MKNGALKNDFDLRDYSYERTFGSVDLSTLPEEYNADLGLSFPDQNLEGYPNGCTGYTQSETGQDEYGVAFNAPFVYEKTLIIGDYPPNSPVRIRDSFKATNVYGLEPKDGSATPETYRRGKYFDVDKVGDYFDGARNALWLNRLNRRTLSCGTPWFVEWIGVGKDGILKAPKKYEWGSKTVGHNYKVCGWKQIKNEPHLILKAWQGPDFGDKGYVYISREVFNKTLAISGTYLYIQTNAGVENVERVKLDIFEVILTFIRRILQQTPTMPPEAPKLPVEETLPPEPKKDAYLWDTQLNSRHSIRLICDEEGLSVAEKNLICAVIGAESGWKNTAKNLNKNKAGAVVSVDYGICQINDHYHIGPGKSFPSVEYVLENPDKVVRWMIKMYRQGHLDWWIAYKNGSYKAYL